MGGTPFNNEGAGGEYDKHGKPIVLQVQAGEKVYQDFTLEVSDPGGHSSLPKASNAIVRLSAGLARLGPGTSIWLEDDLGRRCRAAQALSTARIADSPWNSAEPGSCFGAQGPAKGLR